MELMQIKKLRELKSLYAAEIAMEKNVLPAMSDKDMLESLLVMDLDKKIHDLTVDVVRDWPGVHGEIDAACIGSIIDVLARQANFIINVVRQQDPEHTEFLHNILIRGGLVDDRFEE